MISSTVTLSTWRGLGQQTKHGDPVWRSDKYLAVHDHRRDEFIVGTELVADAGLVGVVKLRQICGIESMKNRRTVVLDCPHDSVACAIGRDAGRGAGIRETGGSLHGRAGR